MNVKTSEAISDCGNSDYLKGNFLSSLNCKIVPGKNADFTIFTFDDNFSSANQAPIRSYVASATWKHERNMHISILRLEHHREGNFRCIRF